MFSYETLENLHVCIQTYREAKTCLAIQTHCVCIFWVNTAKLLIQYYARIAWWYSKFLAGTLPKWNQINLILHTKQ